MVSAAKIASIAGLGLLYLTGSQALNLREEEICTGFPLETTAYSDISETIPEFALDDPDVFEAASDDMRQLSTEAFVDVQYSSLPSFLQDDKKKCITCVKKTSQKVMCYAFKYIKKYCEKTKCKRVQKYCKIIEEHKAFGYGLVWEKIQPLGLGAAYCCGSGECKNPSLLPKLVSEEEDLIPQDFKEFVTVASNGTLPTVLSQQGDAKGKDCKDCIHHSMAFVMHHMFDVVNKYCEKSKEPHVKKMCEFIHSHKEVAAGYIFGAIEPWKYAKGFCYGNKKCKGYHDGNEVEYERYAALPQIASSSIIEFD